MSQEKVREILSHVDMTKIDLSSFQMSEKKFNEVARIFHHRVVVSSLSVVCYKDEYTDEEVATAFKLLRQAVCTPEYYYYDESRKRAREYVDIAIKDLCWSPSDPNVQGMRVKVMNNQLKKMYKDMRHMIEQAMEHDNDFIVEMDDEKMARHMAAAKRAILEGEDKARALHEEKAAEPAKPDNVPIVEMVENKVETTQHAVEEPTVAVPQKVPFWKKLFGKVH